MKKIISVMLLSLIISPSFAKSGHHSSDGGQQQPNLNVPTESPSDIATELSVPPENKMSESTNPNPNRQTSPNVPYNSNNPSNMSATPPSMNPSTVQVP
jgi:hypothetical protein